VLLSTEAAGMLSTGTAVVLADSEGGAGTSKATDGLLAKGDDTLSRTVDVGFETAARFLDSRNLLVAFRIGMSEIRKTIVHGFFWNCTVEIQISKTQYKNISKRKITSVQALPLSSPDVLEQAICEKKKNIIRFFFSG
jgi:hypothetical protein